MCNVAVFRNRSNVNFNRLLDQRGSEHLPRISRVTVTILEVYKDAIFQEMDF